LEANDVTINYNKEKDVLYYDCPIISRNHIEPINMLHFLLHSYDGVNGISLLTFASRTLGITNANENAAKSFFENGMNLSGVLRINTPVTKAQKDEIRASFQQVHNGQSGGLAIINANMEYNPLSLNPQDAQLLESRQWNVADIARFFNINPLLLGGNSGATYSSVEMLQSAFLVHTLQPYISMIESEMNRKLLKPSENNLSVIIETGDLLRVNKAAQAQYYKNMVDSGILSRNEIRKELGYNGIKGGDDVTIAYSDAAQNKIGGNKEENKEKKPQ
jgi:HK97 family phage portal protein